jgi:hypothetical protein
MAAARTSVCEERERRRMERNAPFQAHRIVPIRKSLDTNTALERQNSSRLDESVSSDFVQAGGRRVDDVEQTTKGDSHVPDESAKVVEVLLKLEKGELLELFRLAKVVKGGEHQGNVKELAVPRLLERVSAVVVAGADVLSENVRNARDNPVRVGGCKCLAR